MTARSRRIRSLEFCDPNIFGQIVITKQTIPLKNPRVKSAIWAQLKPPPVHPDDDPKEYERRRASVLLDQLLLEIYSNLQNGNSDYNSATSSKSQKATYRDAGYLRKQGIEDLRSTISTLEDHVVRIGSILVRQLKRRDALRRQRDARCDVISHLLRKRVPEFSPEMRFSIEPLPGDSGFSQWHSAMKMVSQLPEGIPPEFRRRLWLSLADKHLSSEGIDWAAVERNCFSEWSHPADAELGVQIVKDLHRTGCSLFCGKDGQENQALLKKVLLAYARWNKAVGYCQGFNMLAALILQVTEKCESEALKLMIYLIEGVLPDSYFADSLRGLSVDMAVFRELLRTKLPRLSKHLDTLQVASKEGTTSYEPPLTNVFTMQWFLTLFCNCLPQPTVLRVWDLILLEGNEILLRTALAIWQVLGDRIMTAKTADEFYCVMGTLMREILEYDLIDANTLVKGIVTIGPLTELHTLREHYLYNINPWGSSAPADPDKRLKVYHKDRLVLDIGVLKKQYTKLKQRQRQAHIIFNTAVARQTSRPAPVAMNHLLLGKSALVPAKRLGPPKGAVPPARVPPPKPQTPQPVKTLHWKDTTSRRDSSSSSTSSSDTELCDEHDDVASSDEDDAKCQLPDDNLNEPSDTKLTTEDNTLKPKQTSASVVVVSDLMDFETKIETDNQIDEIKSDIFDNTDNSDLYELGRLQRSDSTVSEDGFDFEKFLEERVKSFKEKNYSSEESIDDTSEQERLKYARRNSVRALEIIQENSLILHRILQCQSRMTPTPPPTEEEEIPNANSEDNSLNLQLPDLIPIDDEEDATPTNEFSSERTGDDQEVSRSESLEGLINKYSKISKAPKESAEQIEETVGKYSSATTTLSENIMKMKDSSNNYSKNLNDVENNQKEACATLKVSEIPSVDVENSKTSKSAETKEDLTHKAGKDIGSKEGFDYKSTGEEKSLLKQESVTEVHCKLDGEVQKGKLLSSTKPGVDDGNEDSKESSEQKVGLLSSDKFGIDKESSKSTQKEDTKESSAQKSNLHSLANLGADTESHKGIQKEESLLSKESSEQTFNLLSSAKLGFNTESSKGTLSKVPSGETAHKEGKPMNNAKTDNNNVLSSDSYKNLEDKEQKDLFEENIYNNPQQEENLSSKILIADIEEVDYNLEKYRQKLGSPVVEEKSLFDETEKIEICDSSMLKEKKSAIHSTTSNITSEDNKGKAMNQEKAAETQEKHAIIPFDANRDKTSVLTTEEYENFKAKLLEESSQNIKKIIEDRRRKMAELPSGNNEESKLTETDGANEVTAEKNEQYKHTEKTNGLYKACEENRGREQQKLAEKLKTNEQLKECEAQKTIEQCEVSKDGEIMKQNIIAEERELNKHAIDEEGGNYQQQVYAKESGRNEEYSDENKVSQKEMLNEEDHKNKQKQVEQRLAKEVEAIKVESHVVEGKTSEDRAIKKVNDEEAKSKEELQMSRQTLIGKIESSNLSNKCNEGIMKDDFVTKSQMESRKIHAPEDTKKINEEQDEIPLRNADNNDYLIRAEINQKMSNKFSDGKEKELPKDAEPSHKKSNEDQVKIELAKKIAEETKINKDFAILQKNVLELNESLKYPADETNEEIKTNDFALYSENSSGKEDRSGLILENLVKYKFGEFDNDYPSEVFVDKLESPKSIKDFSECRRPSLPVVKEEMEESASGKTSANKNEDSKEVKQIRENKSPEAKKEGYNFDFLEDLCRKEFSKISEKDHGSLQERKTVVEGNVKDKKAEECNEENVTQRKEETGVELKQSDFDQNEANKQSGEDKQQDVKLRCDLKNTKNNFEESSKHKKDSSSDEDLKLPRRIRDSSSDEEMSARKDYSRINDEKLKASKDYSRKRTDSSNLEEKKRSREYSKKAIDSSDDEEIKTYENHARKRNVEKAEFSNIEEMTKSKDYSRRRRDSSSDEEFKVLKNTRRRRDSSSDEETKKKRRDYTGVKEYEERIPSPIDIFKTSTSKYKYEEEPAVEFHYEDSDDLLKRASFNVDQFCTFEENSGDKMLSIKVESTVEGSSVLEKPTSVNESKLKIHIEDCEKRLSFDDRHFMRVEDKIFIVEDKEKLVKKYSDGGLRYSSEEKDDKSAKFDSKEDIFSGKDLARNYAENRKQSRFEESEDSRNKYYKSEDERRRISEEDKEEPKVGKNKQYKSDDERRRISEDDKVEFEAAKNKYYKGDDERRRIFEDDKEESEAGKNKYYKSEDERRRIFEDDKEESDTNKNKLYKGEDERSRIFKEDKEGSDVEKTKYYKGEDERRRVFEHDREESEASRNRYQKSEDVRRRIFEDDKEESETSKIKYYKSENERRRIFEDEKEQSEVDKNKFYKSGEERRRIFEDEKEDFEVGKNKYYKSEDGNKDFVIEEEKKSDFESIFTIEDKSKQKTGDDFYTSSYKSRSSFETNPGMSSGSRNERLKKTYSLRVEDGRYETSTDQGSYQGASFLRSDYSESRKARDEKCRSFNFEDTLLAQKKTLSSEDAKYRAFYHEELSASRENLLLSKNKTLSSGKEDGKYKLLEDDSSSNSKTSSLTLRKSYSSGSRDNIYRSSFHEDFSDAYKKTASNIDESSPTRKKVYSSDGKCRLSYHDVDPLKEEYSSGSDVKKYRASIHEEFSGKHNELFTPDSSLAQEKTYSSGIIDEKCRFSLHEDLSEMIKPAGREARYKSPEKYGKIDESYKDLSSGDIRSQLAKDKSPVKDTKATTPEMIEVSKNSKYTSILEYSRNLDERFNNLILKAPGPNLNYPYNADTTAPSTSNLLKSPKTSPKSPTKSPSHAYNPFPVNISSRQNKEVAVRLGLYKKT